MNSYDIGDLVDGIVTGIEDYGIFVSINDNCTGLIHISEISDSFVKNVNDYAEIDEKIVARVIGYDNNSHLKLSVKGLNYRPSKKNLNSIKETKSGFHNLKESLKYWIDEKCDEINEKV